MTSILISSIFFGIPVVFGAYLIFCASERRDISTGFALILYGVSLGAFVTIWIPEGKLMQIEHYWSTPTVIVISFIAGAAIGVLKRRSKTK